MSFSVIFSLQPELFLGIGPAPKCCLPTMSKRSSGNVIMKWREIHCGRLCRGLNGNEWRRRNEDICKKRIMLLPFRKMIGQAFARFLDPQKLTVMPTGADTEILPTQWRKGDAQLPGFHRIDGLASQ